MAQVKILQGGGTPTDQVDLFEWEGVGKYERKPMILTLTKNLAGYADHLGLTGDRRNRFMTNGAAAIKALEAGQLRRLADGSYSDASGVMSSTGKYDKNWLGRLKDTDNNAYNDIAGYFDAYMNKASVYDPEKAKKEAEARAKEGKTKFVGDTYLRDRLAQKYYAGTFNTADWFDHRDETGRLTGIADELDAADYNTIYGKYLWDDTGIDSADTLRTRAQALSTNLRNGKLDNADYNTAAALGINLDTFLKKPDEAPKEPTREEQQASAKETFIKQQLDAGYSQAEAERLWTLDQNQAARQRLGVLQAAEDAYAQQLEDDEWKSWYSQHNNPNTSNLAGAVFGDSKNWSDDSVLDLIQNKYKGNASAYYDTVGGVLSGKLVYKGKSARDTLLFNLRTLRHAYANNPGYFGNPISEGEYIIPGTLNTSNYTAYIYNPSANSYRQVNLLSNSAYENFARGIWSANRKASHKEGGIIKMQDGGYADYQRSLQEGRNASSAWFQDAYSAREQRRATEKKQTEQKAQATGRTSEQYTAGQKQVGTNFTTLEKVRLGTAAADVLSAISAFVPGYGTAVSAVTGVGSTLTNLGADIADDSVSGWQAAGNAAMGLGLDVIGLIPGLGAGAKAGKIAKVFAKIAPKALLAWGAWEGGGPAIAAANKLMKDSSSMTVDDWRALAGGLQLLAGGARYAGGKRRLNKFTTKQEFVQVRAKDGRMIKMAPEQFDQLKNAKGLAEQNKVLKNIDPQAELGREFRGRSLTHPFKTGPQTSKGVDRGFVDNSGSATIGHDEMLFRRIAGVDTRIPTPAWMRGFGLVNNPNYTGPRTTTTRAAGQPPKRRILALGEGETRVRQGNNIVRTGKLTDAEIKLINKNRKAAGLQPLSQKEIDTINARATNNTPTLAPTLQERLQQRRYDREHSVEADVARARQEIEAANRLAQRPVIAAQAQTMVADQTIPARMGLQDFINSSIPGRQSSGAARASRQRMYEGLWPSSTAQVSTQTVQPRISTRLMIDQRIPKKSTPKARAKRLKDIEAAFADPAQFRGSDRARFMVQDQTRPARLTTKQLIESRFPKKPATGAARKNRQKALEELLGPLQRADNRKVGAQKAAKTRAAKKKAKTRDEKLSTLNGAYKLGGRLIPRFKNPSGPISNTKSTANWLTDIYGTDAMTSWLGGYNENNYGDFNTLQLQYYDNLQATGFDPNKTTRVSYNLGVYDRQGRFNTAAGSINGVIETLAGPNGKITRAGTTGDNAAKGFQDGYFGFQEYLRHGGTQTSGLSEAQLADINKLVGANNLEYYFDPTTGMGMLRPLVKQEPQAEGPTEPASPEVTSPTVQATTARAGNRRTKNGGSGKGWNLMPEDVLATSRALIGFGVNARAARQQKAGMRPLITDTWENVVSPEWDYFAQRAGEDAYAGLTSFAGRTRTANSQDQFAGQLEAENKGRLFIAQGNQQAANRFYSTDRLRQQESDAAKARRVENANANTGRMLAVDAAKHQIDAALTTAQYAQVLAPWMAGIENQYRQNRAALRQMDASAYQRSLLASMQADYDKAVESGDKDAVKRVTDQYYKDLQDYNKRAYSSPWLIQRTTSLPQSGYTFVAKEGGRLTAREREVIQRARDFNKRMLADNKQFHKDIMESKREHNKLIAGMSNLTADLIKSGMKWK